MKNVLLVDTDQPAVRAVERALTRRIKEVRFLHTDRAQECLDRLRRGRFDVAVVNIDMPDLSGFELLELLRMESIRTPVIAVAQANDERMAVRAMRAGAADFVAIDRDSPGTLVRAIERVLWDAGQRQPAAPENPELNGDESTEAMKTAVGTLSHEINNPLMTILGTAELILSEKDRLDSETVQKMRVILRSARRIEKTLRRLSDLSESAVQETASGRLLEGEPSGS